MPSATRPAVRAGAVVALSILTSAAAHADAAHISLATLLPTPRGWCVLLAAMAGLWLVAAGGGARLHHARSREAHLLGCFALGQLLGHLAWSAGSAGSAGGAGSAGSATPPVVIGQMSGVNTAAGMPQRMATMDMAPGMAHAQHAAMSMPGMGMPGMPMHDMSMPGMGAGHAHSMGAVMIAMHLCAAVVSQLLLRAVEHLRAHARDWLASLTPYPLAPIQPVPVFRPALDVILRRSTWALPRPPPRRGPPRTV